MPVFPYRRRSSLPPSFAGYLLAAALARAHAANSTLATCSSTGQLPAVLRKLDRGRLLDLLNATDLLPALTSPAALNYTLFAPSDDAILNFARALELDLDRPASQLPKDALRAILALHVVPAAAASSSLSDGQLLPTLLASSPLVRPEAACPAGTARPQLAVTLLAPGLPAASPLIVLQAAGSLASVVTRDVPLCGGSSVLHLVDDVLVGWPAARTAGCMPAVQPLNPCCCPTPAENMHAARASTTCCR
jgi:hypothetical protein